MEEILNSWICIFGPPTKFLSDSGREFTNQDLLDLCEKMNIVVKTTAAESPWSNGLVEQHNAVINLNYFDKCFNYFTLNTWNAFFFELNMIGYSCCNGTGR